MHRIIIVGGGIAGLATAYYLQKQAAATGIPLAYTLIESAPQFGGKIVTECLDGFVVEGGPDSFLTQKPWALQLCRELGLSERLLGTNDERRKVYVLTGDRLQALPEGVMLLVPTRLMPFLRSPLISLPGKLRMGLDLVIPPRREDSDESLATFVRRRLGQEALDKIAAPLMGGIYVADAERLSMRSTFPRFIALEQKHGSLIRGMLAQRRRITHVSGDGRRPSIFMTLRGGMGELVEKLVSRLEGKLLAGRRVIGLSHRSEGTPPYQVQLDDGTTLPADAVVLATPAYAAADLIGPLNPDLAASLRAIRYVSTATVSLGYRRPDFTHPLDGFGFVVAKGESRRILACTWTSSKFNARAPADAVLLRAFVGGTQNGHLVDLDDSTMVQMLRDELQQIMGVAAEPILARVYRWKRANPQYDVGHLDRVTAIEGHCNPGLFLAGSAYRGVGVPDCIRAGRQTAEKVMAYLGG